MYKLLTISLLFMTIAGRAQDKKALDSVDKVIMQTIINPAEEKTGGQAPDWTAIAQQAKASYSDVQTDRAVTKAKIYYYYGKDWAQFSTAIVHYTDTYENKDDGALMNKNADFILKRSQNPAEWKAALGWIQHVLDKAPDNQTYKATRDALNAKLVGQ
jgi:hypothetical protein